MITNTNGSTFNFKVVLLGEGCVGKTSLVLRYVEDKFNNNHESTIQASFLNKKLNLNGKRVNLAIWDTAGQEKFHALGPIYYRSSNGAVLVFDITDTNSYTKVQSWVKELRKMMGKDICLVIVGNKTDLEKDRMVSLEEASGYAEKVGAEYCETSAKLNQGVEDMFLNLTEKMMITQEQKEVQSGTLARHSSQKNIVIVDDDEMQQKKSCCNS